MRRGIIEGLVAVLSAFLFAIGLFPGGASSVSYPDMKNALTPKDQEIVRTIEQDQEIIRALEQKITTDQSNFSEIQILPESFTPIRNDDSFSHLTHFFTRVRER